MQKYKTEWNLGLLYKSEKDPAIEADMQAIEKACADFEKKYKGKDFTSTPEKLLEALEDSEKLSKKMVGSKPWFYFTLSSHMNTDNVFLSAAAARLEQRVRSATNKVTFFSLEIGKIPKKEQGKFLRYIPLHLYRYQLNQLFEQAKYQLSEKEENMASLLSQTSYTFWVNAQEKNLFRQMVTFRGKKIPLSEAREMYADLPKKQRHELYAKIIDAFKTLSFLAESEINAICNYKKVMDEKRGYKKPYSATVLANETTEEIIETLAATVTKHFSISQRFYKLHTKLLKEKKLNPADLAAKIGEIKQKFSFEKTASIIKDGFEKVGPLYVEYFEKFLQDGHIDVYPRKGKYSGGYWWKTETNPAFILLNHVDSVRSVETLAHEMGHAFHGELSATQPICYQELPPTTAEVASTFFEQLIMNELEQVLPDNEKIILLHNKINGDISGIFSQIACFNFETELHEAIRQKGQISREDMANMLAKHLRAHRGSIVETTQDHGYLFAAWTHIRMFFYTYTYAFGNLVSRAMYEQWKEDPAFEVKLREFLSAGSSMSPEDIFKKMGIDITKPAFFEAGLKAIDADITKLEKLAKKQGLL